MVQKTRRKSATVLSCSMACCVDCLRGAPLGKSVPATDLVRFLKRLFHGGFSVMLAHNTCGVQMAGP